MRVAAITSGRSTPSARYRVRQFVGPLREFGIHVHEFVPRIEKYASPSPKLRQRLKPWGLDADEALGRAKMVTRLPGLIGSYVCQATWLERVLLPEHLTWERYYRRPMVFDFDDAIWMHEGREGIAQRIVEQSAHVVAGNGFLRDWASQYSDRVRIIPTAVDTDALRPAPDQARDPDRGVVLGWIGTSSNLPYLYAIEKAIRAVLEAIPKARLVVVSDQPPALRTLPSPQVHFVRWYPGAATRELPGWSLGLMPLENSAWVQGKCSLKMLQYMAAGLPVCVSPYGMNAEILKLAEVGYGCETLDDWLDCAVQILRDPARGREMGRAGRALVEKRFSLRGSVQSYADVLRSVSKR